MARKAQNDIPGWLPFAVIASGFVAVAAGIKAGWKTAADQPSPGGPSVAQAGVVRGWAPSGALS